MTFVTAVVFSLIEMLAATSPPLLVITGASLTFVTVIESSWNEELLAESVAETNTE